MEQQYVTPLLEAYIRGYEKRHKGMPEAPERKDHYFKAKDDLPRVRAGWASCKASCRQDNASRSSTWEAEEVRSSSPCSGTSLPWR